MSKKGGNVMLYKCYKQVIAYGIFRVPFRIFRFVSGAELIKPSFTFQIRTVLNRLKSLETNYNYYMIRLRRRFLQRIIYYNYI